MKCLFTTQKIEKNPTKKLKEILKINRKNEKNYPKKSNGFGIKKQEMKSSKGWGIKPPLKN